MMHPLARCCWCGRAFVWATVKETGAWLCPTEACWTKQVQHAMVTKVKGGQERVRFVPLPRQVDAVEAVLDPRGPIYILIGGAAGGSKSRGVREIAHRVALMVPGYRVLLLRRTYRELEQTHLRDVELEAPEMGAEAVPSAKVVRYPNGSVLQFGHCETSADAANYLSAEYDLIIFDELVTFEEVPFLLISSRARSTKAGVVPKVLAGTNPGGPQSHWVRARFIDKTVETEQFPDYRPAEWAFIPSKLEDNPYLDEQYERKLLSLPPELRKAYRDGNWDIFPGQYYSEFQRKTHVTLNQDGLPGHIAYPTEYPRSLCMDYGYVKPGYIGWIVHLPEGGAYLEEEYVPQRVSPFKQGEEIGRRCRERKIRPLFLVYDTQMNTPDADTGEPIIETVKRGMRKAGCAVAAREADKDRKNGWARLRAWFALDTAEHPRPWFQVSGLMAPYAARTIPALISKENDPEDVDTDGEDHAADAIRYWAMSRPAPGTSKPVAPPPPMSLGWLKQRSSQAVGLLDRRSA